MSSGFFVKCDPTRGISPTIEPNYEFSSSDIVMHHMETVRKDLFLKYESTTRGVFDRTRLRELVEAVSKIDESSKHVNFKRIIFPSIGDATLTRCENRFNIPYTKWRTGQ